MTFFKNAQKETKRQGAPKKKWPFFNGHFAGSIADYGAVNFLP